MNDLLGQAVKLKEAQVRDSRAKWYSQPRAIRETVYRCLPTAPLENDSQNQQISSTTNSNPHHLLRYISDQNLISTIIEKKCSFLLSTPTIPDGEDENIPKIEFSSDLPKCVAHSQQIFEEAASCHQTHQKYREARELYIDALSVFCFVLPTKKDWSKKGFADEDLLFFLSNNVNRGEDENNNKFNKKKSSLIIKAQIGYIICSFKLNEFADCVEQSKFILDKFDPSSLQAAFWYARAKTETPSSGAVDTDNAIDVLRKTLVAFSNVEAEYEKEDSKKAAALFVQKQETMKLLMKLESEKKESDSKGKKMFAKMFDKTSNEQDSSDDNNLKAQNTNNNNVTIPSRSISEYQSSWKTIEDEAVKRIDANQLNKKILFSNNQEEKQDLDPQKVSTLYPLVNLAQQLISSATSCLAQNCRTAIKAGGFTSLKTMLAFSDMFLDSSATNSKKSVFSFMMSNESHNSFQHLGAIVSSVRDAVGKYGFDVDRILPSRRPSLDQQKDENLFQLLDADSGCRETLFCNQFDQDLTSFWIDHDLEAFSRNELICEIAALQGKTDDDDVQEDENYEFPCAASISGQDNLDELEKLRNELKQIRMKFL